MPRRLVFAALVLLAAIACDHALPKREQKLDVAEKGALSNAVTADATGRRDEQGFARNAAAAPTSQPEAAGEHEPTALDVHAVDSILPTMLIRTGQASVEVDSLDLGIARVRLLAARAGGFVANTSIQSGRDQSHSATLEIKVPAARFDELLTGLSPIGRVESVNVTAEDVGEEYVDVAARETNARRLEDRLVQLLATRTGKLGDVLQVEHELARVREEIERYDGRLRYLRAKTATSTLTVVAHEPLPVVGNHETGNVIVEAMRQSWRNFVGFVAVVITSLGTLLPTIVLIGLAVWGVARLAERVRGRSGPDQQPPSQLKSGEEKKAA